MAYRGYTQAQNKASQKYQKAHLDQIAFRVKKGTRDRWKEAAESAGMSFAGFVCQAVEDKIAGLPRAEIQQDDFVEIPRALPEDVTRVMGEIPDDPISL